LDKKTVTWRFGASFGGLGATYIVHLRLTGKLVVDFQFVLTELLSPGVTAKALPVNTDLNSDFSFDAVRCRCSHSDITSPKSVLRWM